MGESERLRGHQPDDEGVAQGADREVPAAVGVERQVVVGDQGLDGGEPSAPRVAGEDPQGVAAGEDVDVGFLGAEDEVAGVPEVVVVGEVGGQQPELTVAVAVEDREAGAARGVEISPVSGERQKPD